MDHLKKFDELIAMGDERLRLSKELKNSVEYESCDYTVARVDSMAHEVRFVLIRKIDKKQLSHGTATEVKRYIERVGIDPSKVFDISLIGIVIDKPELEPHKKVIELSEKGAKQFRELKDSKMYHDSDYHVIKDGLPGHFKLIDVKTSVVKSFGTPSRIRSYMNLRKIDPSKVFKYELIEVKVVKPTQNGWVTKTKKE